MVNTPDVSVVNRSPVPVTGTVEVVNRSPVPVTGTVGVADNPASQAVQQQLNILAGPGSNSITIPVGKIFVLETVSFELLGGTLDRLTLNVTGNLITGGTNGMGPVDYSLTIPSRSGFIEGTQSLRLYAQPGTILFVDYQVTGSPIIFFVSLSGYFVNAQ